MGLRLHFTAGEPSGDIFGRDIIGQIRHRASDVEIVSLGGEQMAGLADRSADIDVSPISVLGFVEGIKAYPKVVALAEAAAEHILDTRPHAAILIDSWGFTLRVAQRVRAANRDIRLIKVIGPQIWASRPGRAKTLADTVDHLICMHAMEAPYYVPYGLKTTIMGHPALARTKRGNGAGFRRAHKIGADQPVLLVAPGSRVSEIQRVAPPLLQAARTLKQRHASLAVVIIRAGAIQSALTRLAPDLASWALIVDHEDDKRDAMAAADLALACSGTVTTELAVQETPFLVAYRVAGVTWLLARRLGVVTTPYASVINAVAGKAIAPEFLQSDLTAEGLVEAAQALLADPEARAGQVAGQNATLKLMGHGHRPASEIAAQAILADLEAENG